MAEKVAVIERVVEEWGLTLGGALGARSFGCLLEDGREAVLRLPPSGAQGKDELATLRRWGGRYAPEVLAADERGTAFLLERIRPGTPAGDADAQNVAEVLRGLHVAPSDGLPCLGAVVRSRLERAASRVAAPRMEWARSALDRLLRSPAHPVLLHGAFDARALVHCAGRGLCAVDPQPCTGDPAYDAADWIHGGGRPGRRARFDALAGATELDRDRLRDWCGVIAVTAESRRENAERPRERSDRQR